MGHPARSVELPDIALTDDAINELKALHIKALMLLGWRPAGSIFEQLERGDLLDAGDAAEVFGRTQSTLARWATQTDDEGCPISVRVGNARLYDTECTLEFIMRQSPGGGVHDQLQIRTRLRKLLEMRASAHGRPLDACQRARGVPNHG